MFSVYAAKQGFITWKTSVIAKKIDGIALETYGMVLASFLLQDSQKRLDF